MTKKIIFPLAALILLSACAGKFGLQKRRYTKGYYFSVSKKQASDKKENTAHHQTKRLDKAAKPEGTAAAAVYNKMREAVPVVALPQAAATNSIRKQERSAVMLHSPLTASAEKNAIKQIDRFKPVPAKLIGKQTGGNSDANLVVLIILAILPILSLIAMYIHDGHKITLNFWIDLILHLTFIGYAIFGVLVVLDVIDFS